MAGAAVYGLYLGAKALWDAWGARTVRAARERLIAEGNNIIARLRDFGAKIDLLRQKVEDGLQQLIDAFLGILGELGVAGFLELHPDRDRSRHPQGGGVQERRDGQDRRLGTRSSTPSLSAPNRS